MIPLLALAIFVLSSAATPQPIVLFSSDAIAVARDAAIEWNRGPLPKGAAFDLPDQQAKYWPGYSMVHYYAGDRVQMAIMINLRTGQVVEPDRCLYFHGPKIRAFSALVARKTGAAPMPLDVLASEIGCDVLKPD